MNEEPPASGLFRTGLFFPLFHWETARARVYTFRSLDHSATRFIAPIELPTIDERALAPKKPIVYKQQQQKQSKQVLASVYYSLLLLLLFMSQLLQQQQQHETKYYFKKLFFIITQ